LILKTYPDHPAYQFLPHGKPTHRVSLFVTFHNDCYRLQACLSKNPRSIIYLPVWGM